MTTTEIDYVSASEAARILGVSRQRVAAMVRDNEIEHFRPWPRHVLIPRHAVESWGRGVRPEPIHKTAVRHWIMGREQVDTLDALTPEYLAELTAVFIDTFRPTWDTQSKANWVTAMTGLLTR
jgi:excisionase family DNA binding protein